MTYTLTEASKATNKAKSTIHAAIKKGRISANRNDLGEYVIDPAELHRVFPPNSRLNDKSDNSGQSVNTGLLIENATLKAKLEAIVELNRQIEAERDNLREQNIRITAILTSSKGDQEAGHRKGFWSRLVG